MSVRSGFWAGFAAVALLPACAAPQRGAAARVRGTLEAEALRPRAERLWQARQAEDWATVFLFEEPGGGAQLDAEQYIAWSKENEPFVIQSFQLGRTQSQGELGWVEVKYCTSMRRFPDVPPRDVERWEKWRLVDGDWYPVSRSEIEAYPEAPVLRDAAEETRLAARFEEAWLVRHGHDWPAFHALIDPREREKIKLEDLTAQGNQFDYLSRAVRWVEVIGDQGKVRVRYEVKRTDPCLTKMAAEVNEVTERWVKYEDTWYRQFGAARP